MFCTTKRKKGRRGEEEGDAAEEVKFEDVALVFFYMHRARGSSEVAKMVGVAVGWAGQRRGLVVAR